MIEVTVNGVSFSSLGLGVKRADISVLPPTRDHTVEIAERDGELDFGSDYGPRIINIECILMADDPVIDYHRKVAKLATIFNAKRGDLIFTFSFRPGLRYVGRYAGTMPIEKIIFDGNLTIPIRMNDPFPEGEEKVFETTITSSPRSILIESEGDEPASPVITLTNTGSNTINGFILENEYLLEG